MFSQCSTAQQNFAFAKKLPKLSAELHIINSVLTKSNLKIEDGDLFHLVSESPAPVPSNPSIIIPHLQPTPTDSPSMQSVMSKEQMLEIARNYQKKMEQCENSARSGNEEDADKDFVTQVEGPMALNEDFDPAAGFGFY